MVRKILIIGAGGIGSYLIPLLDKTGLYDITVSDPDTIEEKNLTYQNFGHGEINLNKAVCMKSRYVDNLDARRLLYRSSIAWLDLRSQGRNAAYISFKADPKMYDTMLAGPDGSFSCQGNSWDGSTSGIHWLHVAIAGMGAEWTQRWFNDEPVNGFAVVNV